ncbi:MAG: sigma-54 dependent transcriptional regulator [Bermanella sp.]
MSHILIVDDEPDILELLAITIRRLHLTPVSAANIHEAKACLSQQSFQLCLTDMRLPDGSGMELITHIQQQYADLPVVMLTAYGSVDVAIEAMKAGAFDFLSKPVELDKLRSIIQNAIRLDAAPQSPDNKTQIPGIIGQSQAIERLNDQINKVARSHAPVFIHGESGTGKELVARAIHNLGPRAEQPFIAVNCGAIPADLMESEFFGHKKGAFTGASGNKEGFFQAAHEGTLFLDEVADLPLSMQVKLLRAIQENRVRPVGSETELAVDVRILSASHKDLQMEVDDKNFREDLFYRLDVINLQVPPLRERLDDVPLLCAHILQRFAQSLNSPPVQLSHNAQHLLQEYYFPGNVRELENILQRAVTLIDGSQIEVNDLHLKSVQPATNHQELSHQLAPGETLEEYLEDAERAILMRALEQCRWNKTAAAEQLGMSFRSMRYRLKKLRID